MNIVDQILAFFAPSLTKALGQFDKAVLKLEAVAEHERQKAQKARQAVEAIQARANAQVAVHAASAQASDATVAQAERVATNIRNLVSPTE